MGGFSFYNILMDVVYVLGKGSLADDLELRYSLRALEQNMLDLRLLYLVGERPDFLKDIVHIPVVDDTGSPEGNIYNKVMAASEDSVLSDDFLLMNDDFFMLEPFRGEDFPFYALKGSAGGSCGIHSFQVHCPIRFRKEWYRGMPFDPTSKACRSPRTFYANFYKAPPTFCDDFILRVGDGVGGYDEQVVSWPCFSVGDQAMLNADFVRWLDSRFAEPSRWEK